ncbi:MAG: hypothetical protein NTW15_03595 [Burkholderiales bacterium]|nr:hypothetical protein [Burkholderiales bacterium]
MIVDLTGILHWTGSQAEIAQQEVSKLLRNPRVSSISSITHLKEQFLGAIGALQHRFSSMPAAADSAARANGVRIRSSRSLPLAASHHSTQTGTAPSRPRTPNALLYKAKTQPVALPIHTARASSEPRRNATIRTAPAKPTVAAAAVRVPARMAIAPQVDRRTAAVHAAVQAIGEWGQTARQLVRLPADATPQRRMELEGLVMRAGQQLQQALVHPEVVRVMKASSADGTGTASASIAGAGSASPPPNGKDPRYGDELRKRLLEAMTNAVGSTLGDLLEHFAGGAQISPERMGMGQLIAATVGFLMPASLRGPVRGSVINGAASSLETYARQQLGIDPENPSLVVANFFFAASATGALHGLLGDIPHSSGVKKAMTDAEARPERTAWLSNDSSAPATTYAQLSATAKAQREELRRMGVGFTETKLHTAARNSIVHGLRLTRISGAPHRDITHPTGQILQITSLPPPVARASDQTPALLHPGMAGELARLKVVHVDTSLPHVLYSALFDPNSRTINIQPNTSWRVFQHEVQHDDFDRFFYRAQRINGNKQFDTLRRAVVHEGRFLRDVFANHPDSALTYSALKRYSNQELQLIERMMREPYSALAINETLSTNRELALMGWRRITWDPENINTRRYQLWHQASDLAKKEAAGLPLSPDESRVLRAAQYKALYLDFVDALRDVTPEVIRRSGIGGAAAVATGGAAILTLIYNENAREMLGLTSDGRFIRVGPE